MDRNSPYYKQVSLLINCIPHVAKETCFALKGGTAINLFVNNFPRLSVDIDLAYLPLEPRDQALSNVRTALSKIAERINNIPNINATLQTNKPDEMRIVVSSHDRLNETATIKIEVSPVARGTLLEATYLDTVELVEEEFGFASIQTISIPDLYGGKLCAAMDRQHPRDLFDVKYLLESRGIDRSIFIGFLAYLLSHNRPISELLNPRWKDISNTFVNEFEGMSFAPVSLNELQSVPANMVDSLKAQFTQTDFDFLYSFKSGKPNWNLAPHAQIQNLPAVQWKLININKMSATKHAEALATLENSMHDWLSS